MSYGRIAYAEYTSGGIDYRLDILRSGASDDDKRLYILNDGLTERVGTTSLDPFSPILPVELEIRILDQDKWLLSNFNDAPADDFRIELYKGAAMHYRLFPLLNNRDHLITDDNPVFTMNAFDGHKRLQAVDIQETGLTGSSNDNVGSLFWRCLDQIGHDLDVRTMFYLAHPGSAGNDPIQELQNIPALYGSSSDGGTVNCYQLLHGMLSFYNCQLTMSDGRWLIMERKERGRTSYQVRDHTAPYTFTTDTMSANTDIDGTVTKQTKDLGFPSYKQVNSNFEYRTFYLDNNPTSTVQLAKGETDSVTSIPILYEGFTAEAHVRAEGDIDEASEFNTYRINLFSVVLNELNDGSGKRYLNAFNNWQVAEYKFYFEFTGAPGSGHVESFDETFNMELPSPPFPGYVTLELMNEEVDNGSPGVYNSVDFTNPRFINFDNNDITFQRRIFSAKRSGFGELIEQEYAIGDTDPFTDSFENRQGQLYNTGTVSTSVANDWDGDGLKYHHMRARDMLAAIHKGPKCYEVYLLPGTEMHIKDRVTYTPPGDASARVFVPIRIVRNHSTGQIRAAIIELRDDQAGIELTTKFIENL